MENKVRITDQTKRISGEVHFEDVTSRSVLERQHVQPMIGDSPNVLNRKIFRGENAAPINVVDFLNGSDGQRIYILGDGMMTITHGTFIFTNTGANKLLAANIVYKFTNFKIPGTPISHMWVEDE